MNRLHALAARLRAQGSLTEIRTSDLRFTLDESSEFLREALGARIGGEEAKAVASLLKKHGLADGASILDAPCGIGRHAIHLARMGYRVSGIDLSPVYIERANHFREKLGLGEKLELKVADLRAVEGAFPRRRFDAAINMWQSLGYWDDATDTSVLEQLHRLTTDSGLLLVDVLNRDHLVKYLTPFGLTRFEDGTEVTLSLLLEQGLVRKALDGLKILGKGELQRKLVIVAHKVSEGARGKIEARGGEVKEA